MDKLAILTRDCAGVNACIRSIVRTCDKLDIQSFGVIKGYEGLIDGNFKKLSRNDVSGIINKGGTILKTSRSKRFYNEIFQKNAIDNLRNNNFDGLIVVGGNGSLTAANIIYEKYDFPVIGIPATIDNDINGVKLTLGADTAVNVALDALDKIRDTATSLERIFIVEVMGRKCGYIALQVALSGGCEEVLIPEMDFNYDKMCEEIKIGNNRGKHSWIIIVAEGAAKASEVSDIIKEKTGLETRIAVLGHIQRGGRPTSKDRILGAVLGNYAVNLLNEGKKGLCVRLNDNCLDTILIKEAIQDKKIEKEIYYKLIKLLT